MTTADPTSGISADPQCIRIVQVSDTHVSRKRAYFVDNWDVFVDEMSRTRPDRIVHSGDVAFDGAADGDDLAFARSEKDRLAAPWLAIPGNHDTGGSPLAIRLQRPINSANGALAGPLRAEPMVSRFGCLAAHWDRYSLAWKRPSRGRAAKSIFGAVAWNDLHRQRDDSNLADHGRAYSSQQALRNNLAGADIPKVSPSCAVHSPGRWRTAGTRTTAYVAPTALSSGDLRGTA